MKRTDGAGMHDVLSYALVLSLAFPVVALAQQQPSTIDPGRLRERFDFQPEPEPAPPPPQLRSEPAGLLPDSLKAIRVTLKEVRIESATVLPGNALQARADSYTGREITGADILELASSLTAMYRNAGYILSLVVVPPQSLADGTLTLRVIEGYIARVNVQAGPGVSAHVQEQLMRLGEKIQASRPIEGPVLERYLLIANDFPGVELRSVLAPSQAPGAADLTLVANVKKVEGFASIDNYGSKYLGPTQLTLGVVGSQLLGVNDQWRFVGVGTGNSEMAYTQLSYSQVVGTEGLRLSAAVSRARTQPGDVLKPFDVHGNADTVSLSAAYPLLRSRNESLTARAAYDHSDVHTEVLGTRVIEDRIRALRLGLSWRVLDRLDGQNSLDVDFSQGLGGTQESDVLKSRVGAKGVFNKLTFDYERSQFVGSNFSFTVGVGGQWANTPLLSSEQYALGGRRFGRAYEPAELVGERALAFRIEPRYAGGAAGMPGLKSWQLFGFYDIGKVWKVGSVTPGTPASQSLASAGLGLRFFLEKNVVAAIEAAWPLTKSIASYQTGGKNPRLMGSLLARF
ncbi:hemolysin activation/secretion protein [Polaromonas sp. CF318]|nr:hemolysin activation/secretion protein [Polaromonas sp. CF318]